MISNFRAHLKNMPGSREGPSLDTIRHEGLYASVIQSLLFFYLTEVCFRLKVHTFFFCNYQKVNLYLCAAEDRI